VNIVHSPRYRIQTHVVDYYLFTTKSAHISLFNESKHFTVVAISYIMFYCPSCLGSYYQLTFIQRAGRLEEYAVYEN